MKLLFIHQNFPGQYKHIAPYLAARGHRVIGLGEERNIRRPDAPAGVRILGYQVNKTQDSHAHPYLRGLEAGLRRGTAVARGLQQLRNKHKFVPDVVCVHPGWGEALFVKDVYPEARMLAFLEFYYRAHGSDVGFDPEFTGKNQDDFRIRIKNGTLLFSLSAMDWGMTPTRWQFDQHPPEYHPRMSIIHDGIDTDHVKPDPEATLTIPGRNVVLRAGDEVITYVARNLEPYRGVHTFIRALPHIQKRRPKAHIVIIGGDGVSYGRALPAGESYRKKYLEEVKGKVNLERVYFLGKVPYDMFLSVLQVSACHVYLTYPFVLSWSLLESMAAGCAVVGSATAPVQEVIRDGENGLLVDFFSPQGVAEAIDRVLSHPDRMAELRQRARETVVKNYDLHKVCLPRQIKLIEDLAGRRL